MKNLAFILLSVILAGCAAVTATTTASSSGSSVSTGRGELLTNGSFTSNTDNWTVETAGTATAQAVVVSAAGPTGQNAVCLTLTKSSDATWHLQLYQAGLSVKKGLSYVMKFKMKTDHSVPIMVNLMQNHIPWGHNMQQLVNITTEWQSFTYTFSSAIDDSLMRLGFSNLANYGGQVYWITDVSLVES